MPVDPKVIYLEADEEITSVVDKLRKTEFAKVVLVVPKEASLLQSIVNLKLLKRQAENLEKSIAVVTTDKVGRNLAEKVGLMTAAKLNEDLKTADNFDLPEPEEAPVMVTAAEEAGPLEETSEVLAPATKTKAAPDDEESIVIKEGEDEEVEEPETIKEEEKWDKKQLDEPKEQNLMPRFPFKKSLLVGAVGALVLAALAFYFLPRAKATIMVSAEKKPVSMTFKGNKGAEIDTEKAIIPTQILEVTKEGTKKFQATGKKNIGTKASGNLKVTNCTSGPITLATFSPTGHSDLVYTAPNPITVDGQCGQKDVYVEAAQPGEQYNGYNGANFYAVKANDSNVIVKSFSGLTGGTTKEIKYVTESDISTAKSNYAKELTDEARTEFNKKAEEVKVLDESEKEEVVSATADPTANKEADEFSLTVKVAIKALGYNFDDIGKLIKSEVERQLGFNKQIIDDGAKDAQATIDTFDLTEGTFSGSIKTSTYVSSKLDENKIKEDLIGLNQAKADEYLKGIDGVQEEKVEFLPSFIKLFPRLKNHIYLNIKVADKDS